jgi:hypothetical protein
MPLHPAKRGRNDRKISPEECAANSAYSFSECGMPLQGDPAQRHLLTLP